MTTGARGNVAVWVAQFDEPHNIFRHVRKRRRIRIALGLAGVIGGDICYDRLVQRFGNIIRICAFHLDEFAHHFGRRHVHLIDNSSKRPDYT